MQSMRILFDVAIIGGGYAGMAAALQIARSRRRVLVIDGARGRMRSDPQVHGFLSQDGTAPDVLLQLSKAQLMRYPNVSWKQGIASHARREGDVFTITDAHLETYRAKRLILAAGVVDLLPPVPGLKSRWGKYVHLCAFCDAYERAHGAVGMLATDGLAYEQALTLADWSPVTLFTNGVCSLDPVQNRMLTAHGVLIEQERVIGLSGDRVTVDLADRRAVPLDALFIAPRVRQHSALAEQLGCAVSQSPQGTVILVDDAQRTSVPGVFACGDASNLNGSVSTAAGEGATAGIAVHRSLIFEAPLPA